MTEPVIAVVYDSGAAGPGDIVAAAAGRCLPVLVCDRDRPHVAELFPVLNRRARVCDITGLTAAEAADAVAAWRPAGITTFSEPCLEVTGDLADRCGLAYHGADTVHLLTDKIAQRAALRAAGVDATRSVEVTGPDDVEAAVAHVGLPAIVKPRRGFGSRGVHLVETVEACRAAIVDLTVDHPEFGPLMVEEYLTGDDTAAGAGWGDYVSVEALVQGDEVVTVAVTGKCRLAPPFREQGVFLPATTAPDLTAELIAMSAAAVRALGVRTGITHVELKLTPAGPRVLEVHGRLGGYIADLLRRSRDVDMVAAGLRLAMGERPDAPPDAGDGVTFQYFLVPPVDAVGLRAVDGVAALRDLPGVQAVDVRARPGLGLDWRNGTGAHLGTVYGKVGDHNALAALIGDVERTFLPEFVLDTGGRTDSGWPAHSVGR